MRISNKNIEYEYIPPITNACFQLVQKNKGCEFASEKESKEWAFLSDQKVVDELGKSDTDLQEKDTQVHTVKPES